MTRLSRYWASSTGGATGIDVSLDARIDQLAIELRGYGYPQLRDYALAEQHLTGKELSIAELGYLLGFSEPSAFSRAFKRWTGKATAEFRAKRR